MPTKARVVFPGFMHHVLHRGHNRQSVFETDDDYQQYIDDLLEAQQEFAIELHGWCLFEAEVHLLVRPKRRKNDLGRLMQRITKSTTRRYNDKHGSSGTIWNSRFRSSPVQSRFWELACLRYLEVLPVRRGLVDAPWEYPWSSHRMRLGEAGEYRLADCPDYIALGRSRDVRIRQYQHYCAQVIPRWEELRITNGVRRSQLTGDEHFPRTIQQRFGVLIEHRGPGRPSRSRKQPQ